MILTKIYTILSSVDYGLETRFRQCDAREHNLFLKTAHQSCSVFFFLAFCVNIDIDIILCIKINVAGFFLIEFHW